MVEKRHKSDKQPKPNKELYTLLTEEKQLNDYKTKLVVDMQRMMDRTCRFSDLAQ